MQTLGAYPVPVGYSDTAMAARGNVTDPLRTAGTLFPYMDFRCYLALRQHPRQGGKLASTGWVGRSKRLIHERFAIQDVERIVRRTVRRVVQQSFTAVNGN